MHPLRSAYDGHIMARMEHNTIAEEAARIGDWPTALHHRNIAMTHHNKSVAMLVMNPSLRTDITDSVDYNDPHPDRTEVTRALMGDTSPAWGDGE